MDSQFSEVIWTDVIGIDAFEDADRHVIKVSGKQILIFKDGDQFHACNNRCPHEGYPLSEGNITDGCVLTCNWHNWKFDLDSGETLVGGDKLRRYPVKSEAGRIWIDISDPPAEQTIKTALAELSDCFDDHEYDRMAREVARIEQARGSSLEALSHSVKATYDRFEFGMTHAVAAGADWLRLHNDFQDDPSRRLAAVVEIIGNLSWDSRRMPSFPFREGTHDFDEVAFLASIESEDEASAISYIRGALADGMRFDDLYDPLSRAALAHYQDFGHSLIYVQKAREFVNRVGDDVLEPVLLMLVRSFIYATREDLIPEFKAYGQNLNSPSENLRKMDPGVLKTGGVAQVLGEINSAGSAPIDIYDQLLEAAAWQLLHIDLDYTNTLTGPVQDNVGWLDVTHTVTFANAVRTTCQDIPDLWRPGLLQIGCFLGRNGKYMDKTIQEDDWAVPNPLSFATHARHDALNHGQAEYIVAAHIVKLATAVEDEIEAHPGASWVPMLAAALNRFLNSPLRRKNPIRTASQALDMVKREG